MSYTPELPQILRNNAAWLKDRGTFPKAATACENAADEIERLHGLLQWCRNRLMSDEYRRRLDGYIAQPNEPDHTPVVKSQ